MHIPYENEMKRPIQRNHFFFFVLVCLKSKTAKTECEAQKCAHNIMLAGRWYNIIIMLSSHYKIFMCSVHIILNGQSCD